MSQFLRGLMGAVSGAGQGYFRGKAMQADEQDRQRRAGMEEEREARAVQDQQWQEEDRGQREADRRRQVSDNFRDHLRETSMGARHGEFRRQALDGDEDAFKQYAAEDPSGAGVLRRLMPQPEEPIEPPWRRDGFETEQDQLGYLGRRSASQRAPSGGGGGGASSELSVAERGYAGRGMGILENINQMPPDLRQRFQRSFQTNLKVDPRSSGLAAYRAMQGLQDVGRAVPDEEDGVDAPGGEANTQAIYDQFYNEAIGMGRNPTEAAAYARQKMGQQ